MMIHSNPWKQIKSYSDNEKLYGRDDDTERFMKMLLSEHYVVLCGDKSVGKTSFINACICPAVREHGLIPVLIRLIPNESYISHTTQIIQLIKTTLKDFPEKGLIKEMYSLENGQAETLLSFFKRHKIEDGNGHIIKPLIVLDQFEEMFNSDAVGSTIFEQLDETVSYDFKDDSGNTFFPFYLLISLREGFVSKMDRRFSWNGFRSNRFYLEGLNEEQAYQVITKNETLDIDKQTAILILRNITCRNDLSLNGTPEINISPNILSFYLNRLYEKSLYESGGIITKELVNSFDAVNCFSIWYDEIINKISIQSKEYLEDRLLTVDGLRDIISQQDVLCSGKVTTEELDVLISHNILRAFSYDGDIKLELSSAIFCPIVYNYRIERENKKKEKLLRDPLESERKKTSLFSLIKETVFSGSSKDELGFLKNYSPKKVDYDIFICYRREDGREHARNIQQALERRGYKVFFDYESIQEGEFNKHIIDAIYSCTHLIIVLSPESMKRCVKSGDPVANEIRTALNYKKRIIPVTIDGKEPMFPKRFPHELLIIKDIQYHHHRLDSYFNDSIDKLCKRIERERESDKGIREG